MNNKALLNELERQIKLLESQIARLKKEPEKLHNLDVEVMGEKVKEIYTMINNLETREIEIDVKAPVVQEVKNVPMVEVKPEPEIPEPSAPNMSSEIEEEETNNEERETKSEEREIKAEPPSPNPEPPAPNPEPRPENREPHSASPVPRPSSPEPKAEEQTPKTEERATNAESPVPRPSSPESIHKPEPVTVETEADSEPPKTTADLFSGPTTIADKFQAREDNSIAATVHPQPTRDLKMAIGINDKFLFINELFQGDPSVYNQAIENMNAAAGLDDALKSVETYRDEYKWADNSEAYHRLKKIVNSKYNG